VPTKRKRGRPRKRGGRPRKADNEPVIAHTDWIKTTVDSYAYQRARRSAPPLEIPPLEWREGETPQSWQRRRRLQVDIAKHRAGLSRKQFPSVSTKSRQAFIKAIDDAIDQEIARRELEELRRILGLSFEEFRSEVAKFSPLSGDKAR
jgi:hypothetical protein